MDKECTADEERSIKVGKKTFDNRNQPEQLLERLRDFQNRYKFCDVQLRTGAESFPAHKIILACASKYFEDIFNEAERKSVDLRNIQLDIDKIALRDVINYFYSGKIDINVDNVGNIQSAASTLQVVDLVNECNDFLEKNIQSCKIFIDKRLTEIDTFITAETKFINRAISNFMNVYKTVDFLTSNFETIVKILESDDLDVPSEDYVFDAVKKWILYDIENREKLKQLFDYVRFPLISHECLFDEVVPFGTTIPVCLEKAISALKLYFIRRKSGQMYPSSTIPRKSVNKIYAVGNWGTETSPIIELYDHWNDRWIYYAIMNIKKTSYGVAIHDEKLYIVGGWFNNESLNTVEEFDLKNGNLTILPRMNQNRHQLKVAILGDGDSSFLYAIGGRNDSTLLKTVERFDFNKKYWSYAASMSTPREAFGVTTVNEKIYVAGGKTNNETLKKVEVYDPTTDEWSLKIPMSVKRNFCTLTEHNGVIYAVGGYEDFELDNPLNSIEKYDPENNCWSIFLNMPNAKGSVGAGFMGDNLVVLGGKYFFQSALSAVDIYDMNSGVWKAGKPLEVSSNTITIFPVPWKLINNESPKKYRDGNDDSSFN